MENSREFINSITDGENLEAEIHFSNSMTDKVGAALELRRIELASDSVNEAGPEMQRAAMKVGKQSQEMKKGKYTPKAKMAQDRAVASLSNSSVKIAKTVRDASGSKKADQGVKVNVKAREKIASKKGPGAGAILRGQKTSEKMGTDRSGYGSKSELDIGSQTSLQRQVKKTRNKEAEANRSGGDDDVA